MGTYTGNTVEEAIERGLRRERIARENAHVEIEQRDSKGFFGVGKKRARVTIEPIQEDTVRRADRMATRGVDESDMEVEKAETAMEATLRLNKVVKAVRDAGYREDDTLTEEEKQEKIQELVSKSLDPKGKRSEDSVEEIEIVESLTNYLADIFKFMNVTATIKVKKSSGRLIFNVKSEQDALLIGKHGKILQALEVLAKSYARCHESVFIVSVNVGDYNERREAYLTRLAKHAAKKALEGAPVYINDLPANERRIVHHVISKIDGVSSHSEGRDRQRYIVVSADID